MGYGVPSIRDILSRIEKGLTPALVEIGICDWRLVGVDAVVA
ncbi:hypothetical protein BIWAKO_06489 [Bosea sp. BIWAKO-01]|nr:hypothetical protein BIWAKO_06489 [Bosea sp. BIWAKO-01]